MRNYVAVRIDKRVASLFKTWHASRGTTLSWQKYVNELLLKECGMSGVPLPIIEKEA